MGRNESDRKMEKPGDEEGTLGRKYPAELQEIRRKGEKAMKEIKVRLHFFEEVLGMSSADPEIHEKYIASNAPDAPSRKEEVESLGAEEVFEKSMTVFPKEKGVPFLWDYQIKGFFKDSCGMLRKVKGKESSKIKAYKKEIDGLIFVKERKIPFAFEGEIGTCQRPLRASTPQGERIALSSSETIPAGSSIEFTIRLLCDTHEDLVREWLDYGELRGIGQWRNSGKGRFTWEEIK